MHLVYRALEKEPVPSVLPSSLVPPSKRKKSVGSLSSMAPVMPGSPPPPKDSLRSTPSHGSMNSLNSAGSLSPKHTLKSAQVQTHANLHRHTHSKSFLQTRSQFVFLRPNISDVSRLVLCRNVFFAVCYKEEATVYLTL